MASILRIAGFFSLMHLFIAGASQAALLSRSGPIVRPLAHVGQGCEYTETFTASDTVATVQFWLPPYDNCGEAPNSNITELAVVERDVYLEHSYLFTATESSNCMFPGETYERFDPDSVPVEDLIYRADFSQAPDSRWELSGSATWVQGSGLGLDNSGYWRGDTGARLRLSGLVPGTQYTLSLVRRSVSSCSSDDFFWTEDKLHVAVTDGSVGTLEVGGPGWGYDRFMAEVMFYSLPGDTIQVAPGLYREFEMILKPGQIMRGDSTAPEEVILASDYLNSGTILSGRDLTHGTRLEGLTFVEADSGAVRIENSSLRIESCRFEDNSATDRGGAALHAVDDESGDSWISIVDCVFEDNSADLEGGAVWLDVAHAGVTSCTFSRNNAGGHGGGMWADVGTLGVSHCLFEGNSANAMGGGHYLTAEDHAFFEDNSIIENSASVAGGGYLYLNQDYYVPLSRCDYLYNESGGLAGGLYYGAPATSATYFSSFRFVGNAITGGGSYGSAMRVAQGPVTIEQCLFADNTGAIGDDVIEMPTGVGATIRNSTFAFNEGRAINNVDLLERSIIHGNSDGDFVGSLAVFEGVNDNLNTDPLFCDLAGRDFGVTTDSPGLFENNGITDMGVVNTCAGSNPFIDQIADVPEDQGRWVRLHWQASQHDAAGLPQIDGYALYRRQDAKGKAWMPTREELPAGTVYDDPGKSVVGWDYVLTVPARGEAVYQTLAPTLCDSTLDDGACWSAFLVSAVTPDPLVFFDSAPDSGYSVDNLAPDIPAQLVASYSADAVALSWLENEEADFRYFNVYRNNPTGCDHTGGTPAAQLTGTSWIDAEGGLSSDWCYAVTAVDFAGNESQPTDWGGAVLSDVPPGQVRVFGLEGARPNPFNPATEVSYSLAGAGRVQLEIYDARGYKVRTLVDEVRPAGAHTAVWNGRDDQGRKVASGMYISRLVSGGRTASARLTLLK